MGVESATFVSVWDDGGTVIRTKCLYDHEAKMALDIEAVDVEGMNCLDEEYVVLADGTEIRREDGLTIE